MGEAKWCSSSACSGLLLVPLGMGGLIPKKKRRVCGYESSNGAQVRIGQTPLVLWEKNTLGTIRKWKS